MFCTIHADQLFSGEDKRLIISQCHLPAIDISLTDIAITLVHGEEMMWSPCVHLAVAEQSFCSTNNTTRVSSPRVGFLKYDLAVLFGNRYRKRSPRRNKQILVVAEKITLGGQVVPTCILFTDGVISPDHLTRHRINSTQVNHFMGKDTSSEVGNFAIDQNACANRPTGNHFSTR